MSPDGFAQLSTGRIGDRAILAETSMPISFVGLHSPPCARRAPHASTASSSPRRGSTYSRPPRLAAPGAGRHLDEEYDAAPRPAAYAAAAAAAAATAAEASGDAAQRPLQRRPHRLLHRRPHAAAPRGTPTLSAPPAGSPTTSTTAHGRTRRKTSARPRPGATGQLPGRRSALPPGAATAPAAAAADAAHAIAGVDDAPASAAWPSQSRLALHRLSSGLVWVSTGPLREAQVQVVKLFW